jgi:uncharacterized protein (DUF488 family)
MEDMNTKNSAYYRKIQFQNGSYTISLPKDILIEMEIKKGDSLEIELKDTEIKLKKPGQRLKAVYTIGYGNKTLDSMVKILDSHGINEVIDVRNNAFSWKKDFMRENLNRYLQEIGINYVNLPALGAPKEMRYEIKVNNNPDLFFEKYNEWLKKHNSTFEVLKKVVDSSTSAIMCLEENPKDCHRSVLAKELLNIGYDISHL